MGAYFSLSDDMLCMERTSSVCELLSLLRNTSSSKFPNNPSELVKSFMKLKPLSCSSDKTESKNSELYNGNKAFELVISVYIMQETFQQYNIKKKDRKRLRNNYYQCNRNMLCLLIT